MLRYSSQFLWTPLPSSHHITHMKLKKKLMTDNYEDFNFHIL